MKEGKQILPFFLFLLAWSRIWSHAGFAKKRVLLEPGWLFKLDQTLVAVSPSLSVLIGFHFWTRNCQICCSIEWPTIRSKGSINFPWINFHPVGTNFLFKLYYRGRLRAPGSLFSIFKGCVFWGGRVIILHCFLVCWDLERLKHLGPGPVAVSILQNSVPCYWTRFCAVEQGSVLLSSAPAPCPPSCLLTLSMDRGCAVGICRQWAWTGVTLSCTYALPPFFPS